MMVTLENFYSTSYNPTVNKSYTLTLADGTILSELKLNGNNLISDIVIADNVFEGNLDTITISDGESEWQFSDILLLSNRVDKLDSKTWFVLGEKTEEQKVKESQDADRLMLEQRIAAFEMTMDDVANAILDGVNEV